MELDVRLHLGEMLVEKISNAVGELYDPYGIKKARKDFVGKVLDGVSKDSTLSHCDKIAIEREISLMLKKNQNRTKIVENSVEYFKDTAKPDMIDDAWVFNFWDKAGTVSDEVFQDLWSRILAEEINEPNSISKRLLHNLSLMSANDANNFITLARFCFLDGKDNLAHPIIFMKEDADFYSFCGLSSYVLKELEQFCLIETNYDTGFKFKNKKVLLYQTTILEVIAPRIPAGNVRLTSDGQKLFAIVNKYQNSKILERTIEKFEYHKCEVNRSNKIANINN